MNYFFIVWRSSSIWTAVKKQKAYGQKPKITTRRSISLGTKVYKTMLWSLNSALIALSTILGVREFPEYKNHIGYEETLKFVSSRKHYIWEYIYVMHWSYFVEYKKQRLQESTYYDIIMECLDVLRNMYPYKVAHNYTFMGTNTLYGTKVDGEVVLYDKIRFMYDDTIVFKLTYKEYSDVLRQVKEIF